MITDMNKASR